MFELESGTNQWQLNFQLTTIDGGTYAYWDTEDRDMTYYDGPYAYV